MVAGSAQGGAVPRDERCLLLALQVLMKVVGQTPRGGQATEADAVLTEFDDLTFGEVQAEVVKDGFVDARLSVAIRHIGDGRFFRVDEVAGILWALERADQALIDEVRLVAQ